ncbi:hypothetical protein QBC46DRAFT_380685 [Diplogelasinospora grovesii]|uniref:Uncharacterized protein n=1 Tax=Diplogelasinospora grovesii TaxID=303347 RepID=A0AAN6S6S3_9PEZI|nr:hypothetical protein QBC46DRAFT_380685 [Diplogelasinospora grovesii]
MLLLCLLVQSVQCVGRLNQRIFQLPSRVSASLIRTWLRYVCCRHAGGGSVDRSTLLLDVRNDNRIVSAGGICGPGQ